MSSARPPVISLLLRSARVGGVALGILASLGASAVHAVEIGSTEAATVMPARTAPSSSTLSQTTTATSMWSGNDATLAQLWSLTLPEVQRARVLMQGPRGAFSSPQLSPIEALGIHARTDAERDRYARQFARLTYEDTQRVLAWSRVAQAELQTLAADAPVLSFEHVPKAAVSYEAADMLGVPRSAVVPPQRTPAIVKPRPAVNKALGRAVDNHGRQPARIEEGR